MIFNIRTLILYRDEPEIAKKARPQIGTDAHIAATGPNAAIHVHEGAPTILDVVVSNNGRNATARVGGRHHRLEYERCRVM